MPTDTKSEIKQLEKQIQDLKKTLAELRRAEPRERIENYSFLTGDGKTVDLASLFQSKSDLLVVHNMGRSCTYCTLWADGFNGFTPHLENRSGFVVVSGDSPEIQSEFAKSRGWQFNMVSDQEKRFTTDLGFWNAEDGYWPGVTGFTKAADGTIYKVASAILGPGDDFCALWHMFDLLADGDNGWEPKYVYRGE